MAKRIAVAISQSPSKNPAKRKLEEDIVLGLMLEPGIDVTVVPNLYDIKPDSTGMMALKGLTGNIVIVSWLFERAAHWVLDRNQIHGHVGHVLLQNDDDEEDAEEDTESVNEKERVIDSREIPNRKIYALDLKCSNKANDFVNEVKRIQAENSVQVVGLGDLINSKPAAPSTNGSSANGTPVNGVMPTDGPAGAAVNNKATGESQVQRFPESSGRRWYPVIDYSRCTNCMECVDFCLFGVYGVDRIDTILVEQPDNCRKGCPACSRVCPENAIMFPQHKTPAIAGSNESSASMKIDLSQLFGAPATGKSAEDLAVLERDEQLAAVGRDVVGKSVGLAKRQAPEEDEPKDELDDLVDELNDLDL